MTTFFTDIVSDRKTSRKLVKTGTVFALTTDDLHSAFLRAKSIDLREGRLRELKTLAKTFSAGKPVLVPYKLAHACMPDETDPDETGGGGVQTQSASVLVVLGAIGAGVTIFSAGVALGNYVEDTYFDEGGGATVQVTDEGVVITPTKPDE